VLQRLSEWWGGARVLVEVRRLRREVAGLREAVARIAAVLEATHPLPAQPPAGASVAPEVEVTFVEASEQAELMEIELGLTRARGMLPSEDEILQEYLRRHPAGER